MARSQLQSTLPRALASALLATATLTLPAFAQEKAGPAAARNVIVVPSGTRQPALPPEAGKRLDEKHRRRWAAMTQEERQAIWREFEAAVGPELQAADAEHLVESAAAKARIGSFFAPAPEPFLPVEDPLPPGRITARVIAPDPSDPDAASATKDADRDGLPDKFERKLANNFTPAYFLSLFEFPGTGLATFQDRPDALVPSQVFPTSFPPTVVSYYRVTPLGVIGGTSYLQIDYLSLWSRDDGLPVNAACLSDVDLLSFFGIWSPSFVVPLTGHDLDHERAAVRVVAPAVGGGLNTDQAAYRVDQVFTAAHEGTPVDRSDFRTLSPPAGPEAHIAMFPSLSKHGTYLFWPHGAVSLLPGGAIAAIYGGVAGACFFVSPDTCDLLWFIADEVVLDCIVEKHAPQGWVEARSDLRFNVGEVGRPLPGASFIQTQALRDKLVRRFLIP